MLGYWNVFAYESIYTLYATAMTILYEIVLHLYKCLNNIVFNKKKIE